MKAHNVLLGASAILLLAACGDSDRNQVVGEWHAVQNEQSMTLVFQPDSTFQMTTGTFTGEGTYSVDADRRVVLHPTGALATAVPAGYSGSITDWTLNLCGPGGLCTDFEKMERSQ